MTGPAAPSFSGSTLELFRQLLLDYSIPANHPDIVGMATAVKVAREELAAVGAAHLEAMAAAARQAEQDRVDQLDTAVRDAADEGYEAAAAAAQDAHPHVPVP